MAADGARMKQYIQEERPENSGIFLMKLCTVIVENCCMWISGGGKTDGFEQEERRKWICVM